MRKNYIWSEFYRPLLIKECVLSKELTTTFENIVASGTMQNMMFSGDAGVGKTTVALALAEEMGYEAMVINASLDAGIDVIRSTVTKFASSKSMMGKPKLVIFDEADYLNPNSVQPALRGFIQTFHNNCRFIFTLNYKNRLIEPIHSRLTHIEFKTPNAEKPVIAGKMFEGAINILDKEGITYDKKVVASLISKHFPDFRRILNELQRYSVGGTIDSGILSNLDETSYNELFGFMKNKSFNEVRSWVATHSDSSSEEIFRTIYDSMSSLVEPKTIPQMVLIIADYSYKSAFVADQEINTMAALTEIMGTVVFE